MRLIIMALSLALGGTSALAAPKNENNPSVQQPPAENYFARALSQNGAGAHEQAIKNFTAAIKLNPSAGEYYYNRAIAYYLIKNIAHAKEDLKKTLALKTAKQERLALKALLAQMVIHVQEDNFQAALLDIKLMNNFGLPEEQEAKLVRLVKNLIP